MKKIKAGKILLIDTDVMVYLFQNLYDIDKIIFDKVITFLGIVYSRIWIPQTVQEEFTLKKIYNKQDKQRLKRLQKIKHHNKNHRK